MYEPIRSKSVHTLRGDLDEASFPHHSREEELDIQLAGYLAALLTVTDELRATSPGPSMDSAAEDLAHQITRLRRGHVPIRAAVTGEAGQKAHATRLHQRAHALAGRALVVAAARADTSAAILAAQRMDAHAAAERAAVAWQQQTEHGSKQLTPAG
ncbi:SCO4983 family protein [Streptomyces tsukubensis]|uniref:Uncharacterized protein n=1 Tax=Streptomyces tsukubensis TaxID=83656 RepID=A0A1V4ADB0_9ACTN|nr:hypothetical protein [Streptomyces tsukubensis]OON81397.1 hypothetical protein B1H18_08740 [Streptomyces tsukubensis]QFR95475.1 hypothetical protein GBW32_23690 [Streptomyces tsukubensis]